VLKCMIVVSELSGNKSRIQSQVNNTNYFTANKNKYFLLSATCSAVLLGLAGISDVSAATLNVPVYTPEANSELQGLRVMILSQIMVPWATMRLPAGNRVIPYKHSGRFWQRGSLPAVQNM
ncbi:hypothetical protein, partial [Morganella morganii]|uniref:hypothetical protein n=1 Tax=Morganella morganii TaxID=582 RepID=UPI001C9D2E2B